jgi:1-acyl-sn-glycerol-3-phosphate acyltransferase
MRTGLLRLIFDGLLRLLTRRRVEGLELLPPRGPYILVSNHLSFLDAPLIYGLIGGEHITGWAAEKWERNLIIGGILRMGHAIFIQRGQVDRDALEAAVDWLKEGKVFGMSPEGTRSRSGELQRAKTGVAYLADQSAAPIVPLAHFGTEKIVRGWLKLRRPQVTVRCGPPFRLPDVDPTDRAGSLRRNTDLVMAHLAALLPPEYRGVYADHPWLLKALSPADR